MTEERNNVTIANLKIESFGSAISGVNTRNALIIGNTITDNGGVLTLTVLLPNENLGPEQGEYVKPEQGEYENNVILVKFKEGPALEGPVLSPFGCVERGRPYIDFLNAKYHIDSMKPVLDDPNEFSKKYGLDRWYKLESTKDFDVLNAVREYSLDPGVECAEPNGFVYLASFNGS